MTALNAIAQWLLGGGGSVLKFLLYVFVAWVLVGALPRMRRDAAAKVPQVRGAARGRMREHAKKARKAGRRKGAEWWGWTAAWGAAAVAAEGARFGGYMVRSAWRGWGDHRRRVQVLRQGKPWRKLAAGGTGGGPSSPPPPLPPEPPPGPSQPPPDGGTPGTTPPGHPRTPLRPPRPAPWDRPIQPPRPPQTAPADTGPPQGGPLDPAPPGEAGKDDGKLIPLRPPGYSPAGTQSKGAPVADSEVTNLEAALHITGQMQNEARRALDSALAEKDRAERALASAEKAAQDLAMAGVRGPAYEAFVQYHEAMDMARRAAVSGVSANEMAVQAAGRARDALVVHQDAADQLAATGGAANETKWYGAAG